MSILNISLYHFQPLQELSSWKERFMKLCEEGGLKGTVLLAPEGMNAFVAGEPDGVERFERSIQEWFKKPDLFGKRSWSDTIPYRRLFVKVKKEILTFGVDSVRPEIQRAPAIAPKDLAQWIREGRDFGLLDTRNDFEFEVGSFEQAVHLNLRKFNEFPQKIDLLPEDWKEKPVVMFCTGGIRCEKAGIFLEQKGFKNILQLDGGILKYFEECGGEGYRGACFVFDQRRAVDPSLKVAELPPEVRLMPRVDPGT